jgi:hypothetical protein
MNHIEVQFSKLYLAGLYEQLDKLQAGSYIDVSSIADVAKREKYIAGVKVYIDDNHPHVYFTSDYSKVKKYSSFGLLSQSA